MTTAMRIESDAPGELDRGIGLLGTPSASRMPGPVHRALLASAYSVTSLPLALFAFITVVVLFSLGLALSALVVGAPTLVLSVFVARGAAYAERGRLRSMLRHPAPAPAYLRATPQDGTVRRLLTPLRDPQSWLDVAWSVIGLVTALTAFCTVVIWWATALGGITYWYWERFLPERAGNPENTTLAELIGFGDTRTADVVLNSVIGVVALLTLPAAVRLAAGLHAGLANGLLCSRAELQRRVEAVEGSREAARVAEADSLRRLERDIHDGPQQRLVRLTMDLGRARTQLEADPQRAAQILEDAREQAADTVAELRALSRGIAPPLLVDRGLTAAVTELADGCPVATTVETVLPRPLPPHVETVAYFVVAEALTNVAKHSSATSAAIRVILGSEPNHETGEVLIEVWDDGVGGAHAAKGLGLAGLDRRVEAAEGRLAISSPDGGPTVVHAAIPVVYR